jgi:hypothetical protein
MLLTAFRADSFVMREPCGASDFKDQIAAEYRFDDDAVWAEAAKLADAEVDLERLDLRSRDALQLRPAVGQGVVMAAVVPTQREARGELPRDAQLHAPRGSRDRR